MYNNPIARFEKLMLSQIFFLIYLITSGPPGGLASRCGFGGLERDLPGASEIAQFNLALSPRRLQKNVRGLNVSVDPRFLVDECDSV